MAVRPLGFHRALVATLLLSACNALTGADDLGVGPPVADPVGSDGGAPGDGAADSRGAADAPPSPYYRDASASDDAAVDPDAAPQVEAGADAGVKRVFVTSTTTTANLGGLAGGDLQCSLRAKAAQLGGTWRAWLSTNNVSAISRITASGPWYLTTGVQAVKLGELTNTPISHQIDRDENANVQSGLVWTATDTDGTFLDDDCSDWTSNLAAGHAATGDTRARGAPWTAATPGGCEEQHRLYCFEQ